MKALVGDLKDICLKIRSLLRDAVKRNLAEGVLFSGGLDTSVVAAVASKLVPLKAFTIALQGASAPDVEYALLMSRFLRLRHLVYYFDESQVFETIPIIVKTLRTFDPMEISGGVGILIGLKLAKDNGLDAIMTGDGGDELFAGYPWLFSLEKEKLDSELLKMWDIMTFSSIPLGKAVGVEVKTPLLDPEFKSFAMKLDSQYKIRSKGNKKWGKWIIRKAFEDALPNKVAWRAKVFGSIGMGIWESLPKIFDSKISSEEFEEKRRKYLERDKVTIQDKERLFYYEIYRSAVGVPHPTDPKGKTCPYCNSNVSPASSSHCRTCGAYPI
jgi:asparagine synthase (glutamine-hydrolysing)